MTVYSQNLTTIFYHHAYIIPFVLPEDQSVVDSETANSIVLFVHSQFLVSQTRLFFQSLQIQPREFKLEIVLTARML